MGKEGCRNTALFAFLFPAPLSRSLSKRWLGGFEGGCAARFGETRRSRSYQSEEARREAPPNRSMMVMIQKIQIGVWFFIGGGKR